MTTYKGFEIKPEEIHLPCKWILNGRYKTKGSTKKVYYIYKEGKLKYKAYQATIKDAKETIDNYLLFK